MKEEVCNSLSIVHVATWADECVNLHEVLNIFLAQSCTFIRQRLNSAHLLLLHSPLLILLYALEKLLHSHLWPQRNSIKVTWLNASWWCMSNLSVPAAWQVVTPTWFWCWLSRYFMGANIRGWAIFVILSWLLLALHAGKGKQGRFINLWRLHRRKPQILPPKNYQLHGIYI